MSKITNFLQHKWSIYLLCIPIIVFEMILRPKWNGDQDLVNDWANIFYYCTIFLYGFILFYNERLQEVIERSWKIPLLIASLCSFVPIVLSITNKLPETGYNLTNILLIGFKGITTWFWLIAFLGLAKKCFDFTNKFVEYANKAVLPFYILHQTVIIIIGFYAIQLNLSVLIKFIIILISSFILIVLVYDLIVRRIKVLRILFGMRDNLKKTSS